MMEKKYCLELDEYEYGIITNALICFRNSLIQEEKNIDPVNDIIIKVIDANPKRKWFSKG